MPIAQVTEVERTLVAVVGAKGQIYFRGETGGVYFIGSTTHRVCAGVSYSLESLLAAGGTPVYQGDTVTLSF